MTTMEKESLITAARLAACNSKAFKSNFTVGCAIRTEARERGIPSHIVVGGNVEFNGHPAVHAEVAALCRLFAGGFRAHDVTALAVWCPTGPHKSCGCCLQALSTWFPNDLLMLFGGENGTEEYTLGELLPHAYRRERDS